MLRAGSRSVAELVSIYSELEYQSEATFAAMMAEEFGSDKRWKIAQRVEIIDRDLRRIAQQLSKMGVKV